MSKQVAKHINAEALRFDVGVGQIIEQVVDFWPETGSASLRRDLTRPEKAALGGRADELKLALRPISQASEEMRRAAEALAQLFLGFPSMRNVDAQAMITAYVQHMSDMPLFAVRAACDDVVKGKVKGLDPDWPPTSVRLVEIAEKHSRPLIEESIRISKTLTGKQTVVEVSPEERARVGEKLKVMAQDMTKATGKEASDQAKATLAKMASDNQEKILAEYRRLGIEPSYADPARTMLVSPSLRKLLGGL